ncbi:AAA family ATPase [uncultured Deinococcus sp.]|uniref:ATP-binding protein n=1 Tax=uncultured Deinococcus sp. TaxID=158789 RepID=UPI002589DE11|nr:AAA family ATPase [uncultured Deinococcus sp.]
MLVLSVLGTPTVQVTGQRLPLRPRRLALLTYLALCGPQRRQDLCPLFFPDEADPRARLRLEVHRLRATPLAPYLAAEGEVLELKAGCDAAQFRRDVERGDWVSALAAWRGELLCGTDLSGLPDLEEWLLAERERLGALRLSAFGGRLSQLDHSGRAREAMELARAFLAAAPLSEAACDGLVGRLLAAGQLGEATQVQRAFAARFRAEFGFAPQLGVELAPPAPPPPPRPVPASPWTWQAPPLVGREALLAQLDTWADTAPPGQLLLLQGEAGAGKTALAQAFARRRGMVLTLRGSELHRHAPLHALLRGLRHASPHLGQLDPATLATLAALDPDLAALPGRVPDSGEPGFGHAGVGGLGSEAALTAALVRALGALMEGAATVLLDDLHWLDPSSVRVLLRVLDRVRTRPQPPLLLCTARPGELRAGDALTQTLGDLERAGRLVRLDVPPLSSPQVLRLLGLLLGAVGPARRLPGADTGAAPLADTLHRLSGGNPYVLLAYLRGLEARGLLGTPGGAAPSPEQLERALPSGLADVLLLPLDAAGPPVVALLEAAAVQAQPFTLAAAQVGSGLPPHLAGAALTTALEHRWLRPVPEVPEGSGPPGYALQHDLLRLALVSRTPPARQRALHRRLAEHLDAQFGGDGPGVGEAAAALARHWEEAGEPGRAGPLHRRAAERARALWGHREAIAALESALRCEPDPRGRAELHLWRGRHWQALNALGAWEQELDRAEALLDGPQPWPDLWLRLVTERSHLHWRRGEPQAALDRGAPWADGPWSEERALLRHDRAAMLTDLGRPEEAAAALLALLAEPELVPGSLLAANVHGSLARAAAALDDLPLGLTHVAEALRAFGALGNSGGLIVSHLAHAGLLEQAGRRPEAQAALLAALGVARSAQNLRLWKLSLSNLLLLAEGAARTEDALDYATQGLELAEASLDEAGQSLFAAALDRLRLARREQARAAAGLGDATPPQRPGP